MRIGLDARWIFPEITGIGSYTQELIRHLVRMDTENQYFLFFGSEAVRERTADYAGLHQANHVSCPIVPYGPFSPKSQLLLPGLIRRTGLDVFHSTNFMIPFPGFPRQRRGRTACVVTIHDLIPLLFPEHTPRALKTRFHPVYRRVMKEVGLRADRLITVSESSRNDIIRHCRIPPDRADHVIAIYEAASEHYAPAEHPATGHQTILYVGRLDPYKNVAALVRAFGRILRSGVSNVRLRLIGPPDDRYPEVRQLIASEELAGHIDGPGYVSGDELRTAYQSADVFVLPSLYEGFGLPVLEAMACGTPVVCSCRASLPEVAGDAAWLVDPENIDDLTHAIQTVLHDPDQAATMRRKGLAQAAGFSWDRTARNTLRVYQQLMTKATP